ncbi:hypothetical protein IVB30_17980 [Bradyrhizobium sp. 200]|uniref:hypothetical protein n=1 Tax=Bradyrhizobium sp. 200 TaxID=2782665 RepID=UPI001FFE910F|nr:hypothetical protein [Bradyrhizobium sp. 200]UPJ53038.1 hypothetical protein IVB30_17980 [Bradyrhizobium sp. 200]
MLRWMTPFLVAIFAAGTAAATESPGAAKTADGPAAAKPADSPAATKPTDNPATAKPADSPAAIKSASPAAAKRAAVRAAGQLPPGLPRPHYKYRTTVAPAAAPLYVRRGRTLVVEEEDPDVLFTPVGVMPYAPRVYGTPLLPGSSTLPGYYGTSHSYSYDGVYYGGPSYGPYWNRLPYACGVYGYC